MPHVLSRPFGLQSEAIRRGGLQHSEGPEDGWALGPSPVPGSPPAPEPPLPPRALQRTVQMMRRPLRRAARTEVSRRGGGGTNQTEMFPWRRRWWRRFPAPAHGFDVTAVMKASVLRLRQRSGYQSGFRCCCCGSGGGGVLAASCSRTLGWPHAPQCGAGAHAELQNQGSRSPPRASKSADLLCPPQWCRICVRRAVLSVLPRAPATRPAAPTLAPIARDGSGSGQGNKVCPNSQLQNTHCR